MGAGRPNASSVKRGGCREVGRAPLTRADVMRAGQVAELVGISRQTVYLWARQGKLACRRRGNVVLFLRPEIATWLVDPAVDF
jgi:excisionase family DNA binding protein